MRTLNTLLAAVTIAALTACGGGGGGDAASPSAPSSPSNPTAPTAPATPSAPANVVANEGTLKATAGPSTYAAESYEADAYAALNRLRHASGAGYLSQDAKLDVAAAAHAKYLTTNQTGGHEQDPSNTDFYGTSPYYRVTKAGFDAGLVGEAVGGAGRNGNGWDCVFGLMNSVYHSAVLLSQTTTFGIGFGTDGAGSPLCVINVATTSNERNVQVAPAGSLVAYPYAGQSDVRETFWVAFETPRPSATLFPNMTTGTPVIVNVKNADFVNFQAAGTLAAVVTTFEMKDADGNIVPAAILADPALTGSGVTLHRDSLLSQGFAVLVPLSPLAFNATYTVTFSATLKTGGAPLTKTWSFTTNVNSEPPTLPTMQ